MPVQFNRESSFSKAYSKGQNQGSQRRYRDAATSTIDQKRAGEEAATINAANLDKRLRGANAASAPVPPGSPPLAREAAPSIPVGGGTPPTAAPPSPLAAPVPSEINVERIVGTSPGYGLAGAKMTADRRVREQAREDETTKTFIDLVGKDPATAIAFAKQNGRPMTPGFETALQDQWFSGALADAGARLAIEYKDDPRGYQKAMAVALNYLKGQLDQRQGTIPGAAASIVPTAGMPTPNPPPKFTPSFKAFPTSGGGTTVFDQRTGQFEPAPDANVDFSKTGGAQRPTALMRNAEYLVAQTGVPLVEAINRVLTQRPQHEQSIWQRAYGDVMRAAISEQKAAMAPTAILLENFPRRYTKPDNSIDMDLVVREATTHFENRLAVPTVGDPAAPAAAPPPAPAAPPPDTNPDPGRVSIELPPHAQLPAAQPAPAAAPAPAAPAAAPAPVDARTQTIEQALQAIAAGADPAAIMARLQQMGIEIGAR